MSEGDWYMCPQRMSDGASLREEKVRPDCTLTKNRPEGGLERLVDLSTVFYRSTHLGKQFICQFQQSRHTRITQLIERVAPLWCGDDQIAI
jgi:hypothetical protein